jgi:hypothetical protein
MDHEMRIQFLIRSSVRVAIASIISSCSRHDSLRMFSGLRDREHTTDIRTTLRTVHPRYTRAWSGTSELSTSQLRRWTSLYRGAAMQSRPKECHRDSSLFKISLFAAGPLFDEGGASEICGPLVDPSPSTAKKVSPRRSPVAVFAAKSLPSTMYTLMRSWRMCSAGHRRSRVPPLCRVITKVLLRRAVAIRAGANSPRR